MSTKTSNGAILVVIGTRPEAIKLAPVIAALRRRGGREVIVCRSGQHRDLLDGALDSFGLRTDMGLDVMVAGQSLADLHARLFSGFGELLARVQPSTLVIQGDTATVAVAAWSAFLARVEVAHVEAGLRSDNKWQPFPEEINRRITGILADWHFAPTAGAAAALRREGVAEKNIVITGNTVVDALDLLRSRLAGASPPLGIDPTRPLMIVTIHRRENFGAPLDNACAAIRHIAERHPQLQIVLPLHPNPDAGRRVREQLQHVPSVTLCEALGYEDFVRLMLSATLALSDSGGIQEEGPALGLPVLVLREVTERPEGVTAGSVRLIGTDRERIIAEVERLLTDAEAMRVMATPRQVYGDGLASERIADVLLGGALQRAPFTPA